MRFFFLFFSIVTFINCAGQTNKKIIGKWTSNRRDILSADDKHKVLRSQKLPYFETYEFKPNGTGIDLTVKDRPEIFNYKTSADTLFFGQFIVLIDTLTKNKLVITRLAKSTKKPEQRQYFVKTP
jgi:hypothetical protein